MSESSKSKLLWIVIGAVVGGVVSLSFEYWIKPLLAAHPKINVPAISKTPGEAEFIIQNDGKAPAIDVRVLLWATAVFLPRTDISSIEHVGGVSDAECNRPAIKIVKLVGSGSRPNQLNTPSDAGLIQCDVINPGEKWHGLVRYAVDSGSGGVPGLMAHIKLRDHSENQLARFEDGFKQ